MKKAYTLNIILALLVAMSVLWMLSGFLMGSSAAVLTKAGLGCLQYYTVDSNILMGVAALWMAIMQIQVSRGKRKEIPTYCYVLALSGTVGVTLTFLITLCFLAPTSVYWLGLYTNSNLFLHLVNPLLAIYVFTRCEKTDKIKLPYTLWALVSLALYAIFYVVNALPHFEGNYIDPIYDWYGFFLTGISSVFYIVPIMVALTYGITFVLWKCNRKKA